MARNYKVRTCDSSDTFQWLTCVDYFTKLLEDDLKAVVKPQYVDQIPRAVKGANKTVEHLLQTRAEMDNMQHILEVLGKNNLPVFC